MTENERADSERRRRRQDTPSRRRHQINNPHYGDSAKHHRDRHRRGHQARGIREVGPQRRMVSTRDRSGTNDRRQVRVGTAVRFVGDSTDRTCRTDQTRGQRPRSAELVATGLVYARRVPPMKTRTTRNNRGVPTRDRDRRISSSPRTRCTLPIGLGAHAREHERHANITAMPPAAGSNDSPTTVGTLGGLEPDRQQRRRRQFNHNKERLDLAVTSLGYGQVRSRTPGMALQTTPTARRRRQRDRPDRGRSDLAVNTRT